jgi:hypothetical protein
LVTGWFSFEGMGATAGDLMARDTACTWLTAAGHHVDIASVPPFSGHVRWEEAEPGDYGCVVFVCGPLGDGPPVRDLLDHFATCPRVGLDLTMLDPIEAWNPFDILFERDSTRTSRPDLSFAAALDAVPVVGLVLMDSQPEYGDRDLAVEANAKLEVVAAERECARLRIDTRLDVNAGDLRTPSEVVALIQRADVVLTTRLHGLVLSLRSGVPAVAVDSVAGGAKLSRQAERLGWPWCFPADVPLEVLGQALDECLTPAARTEAEVAARQARTDLAELRAELVEGVAALDPARTGS